jgi:large subunit ribosomal protein L21
MLAVIKTGGKQYLVKEGDKVKIEKVSLKEGESISFGEVLLAFGEDEKNLKLGKPFLNGAEVQGKVVKQGFKKKVTILKKKPKKRYQLKKGHRQPYSEVEISKIKIG